MFRTFFLCLFLAGCATVVPKGATFSGRFAVQFINQDGQPESQNARFSWQQGPERTDIALYSPLGDTLATLAVTAREASLVVGKQPPLTAPDVDSLSARALGWALPVSGLAQWVRGQATAKDGSTFQASPANDTVLTQDGWELRYVSWYENNKPKRIDATRITAVEAEKLSFRILIDEN